MHRERKNQKASAEIEESVEGNSPSETCSVPTGSFAGSSISDEAAAFFEPEHRISVLAEIENSLQFMPTDEHIKACRARIATIRLMGEIAKEVNEASRLERIEEELRLTRAEIGATRGGVSRANHAPSFADPSEPSVFKGH